MKKKVLYLITKSDIGGAQKYVSDLASNLDKTLFETKIIYGGPVRGREGTQRASASNGIKWLSNQVWPWALFLNDWLAIWELVKIYKKERPNIIHLNSSKAGVIGSIAAKIYSLTLRPTTYDLRPKVVFTAHGWVFNPTNALSQVTRWFYIALHKFASLFQDAIICVSEYDYSLAQKYKIIPKQKLTTIHNGIDAEIKFFDKETAKKELLKKIGGNPQLKNKTWIGSVGRLVKEKNYETFICSAAHIPNALFFIIGDGPEYKNLRREIEKNGLSEKFFLISPTGADALFLKAFDLFVMSSIKEGFPYILLEAMAAELPIVVTETGGIPEIINNHQNGLMVSQKNPELLAKAINGLVKNKPIAAELSKMAKKILKEKFNLEKMVNKTAGIYREL